MFSSTQFGLLSQRLGWRNLLALVLCTLFAFATLYYALSTFFAIVNFGWRQPMSDQWRSYLIFLETPFPQNVLQQQNGHRPIFADLFRVAEVNWFHANQLLQLAIGTACAYLTVLIFVLAAWRDRQLTATARWMCVMFAALGVLWLANGRMLFHSNETLHTHLIKFLVVLGAVCAYRSKHADSKMWLMAATSCCVLATFSFGAGIASFPALLVVCVLLRLPWRWILMPGLSLLACLAIYVIGMSGNNGVRESLGFQPLQNISIIAKWTAGPWIEGWLGLATSPTSADLHRWYGRDLAESAKAILSFTGLDTATLALIIGGVGIAAFALRTLVCLIRKETISPLQTLAFISCAFGIGVAGVISIGRLSYFIDYPEQIFADRYLVWPSMFWAGLAILAAVDIAHTRSLLLKAACITFGIALPFALNATHRGEITWAAINYQNAQDLAAAVRSGVINLEQFPDADDASRKDRLHTLELLRNGHLAMFYDPMWEYVGQPWHGDLQQLSGVETDVVWKSPVVNSTNSRMAGHFEGWIRQGIGKVKHAGQIAALDDAGNIVGLAEYSFLKPATYLLRFKAMTKRGFDGYIRDYDPTKSYRLVVINQQRDKGILLSTLPAVAQTAAP